MPRFRPVAIAVLSLSTLCVAILLPRSALAQDTSAQCTLRFDAIWSASTHPISFPMDPHFSGLIGGSHSDQVVFWAPGGLATPGIRCVAETGSKTLLQAEVGNAVTAGSAFALISGGFIDPSPGSVSVSFPMNLDFPLVSVVTMISPSPDWFLGVHGLPLFDGNRWIEQVVVDLPAYDAGTDSGLSYTSPDLMTNPPQPIAQINVNPFPGGSSLGSFTVDCASPLIFAGRFETGDLSDWTTTTP